MFAIFKKDIKVGDKVKLYLTTGKEPEGVVIEIGENYVLLQSDDRTQNRFFDKLIGGWDVIKIANSNLLSTSIDKELGKASDLFKAQIIKNIPLRRHDNDDEKRAFKSVEKEINDLMRQSNFEFALSQIDNELKGTQLDNKYKSTLLLKKAQIYSSINKPDDSEKAYQELVDFNERIKAPSNNLSHLFTELARLQSLKSDKQEDAINSVRKALRYNPNNTYANNLLKQIEAKTESKLDLKNTVISNEEFFVIDLEEDTNAISRMIGVDIKEHKYTNPEIIKNGGKPTAFIAKKIFDEAKATKESDLSDRYPIYLEAAKAFSELNVGSYDLQDYQEAVAFYSMLKGNSLFINFRNNILNIDNEIVKLTRISDSACSYYIEALNLLSNINPKLLLVILANYLKLNIVLFHIKNQIKTDFNLLFKGQFADVFTFCLRNEMREIEKIAYKIVVDCGAASISAWNRLSDLPKGTKVLYGDFSSDKRTREIFTLINEIEERNVNINLKPGEFLKTTFLERRKKSNKLTEINTKLLNLALEPHNFKSIINQWDTINSFSNFLNQTDNEIKVEIDKLLSILQPYLNRNQSERTNMLIQARSIIEKQIKFINENTTYYGRTIFYSLLSKWKREIDILLEEKIAQSYPSLQVIIDPPYYIETDEKVTAPLIIRNVGEATSEGFSLKMICESTEYEESVEIPYESALEIAAGSKREMSFVIPRHLLADSKAIEVSIDIEAIYQKKKITPKNYQFTVEKEPESTLSYEDIPWRDGPIPPEHLFKGRKLLIADLAQHYLSTEKDKPYILYGLTRTGKSSVLEYLRKDLEGDSFVSKGSEKDVITFLWDFSEAASHEHATDFYNYILYDKTYEVIEKYFSNNKLILTDLDINEKVKFKHFKVILEYLSSKNIYPIFFVDEFSFIKTLIDKGTINSAFLHSLRQFALNGLASFIFSGTYDIKTLIRDPKYGITGQLVNAIEYQINEISEDSSVELIEVIDDKLSFTPEAIEHIKFLSGNIPYFIQIICKYCGYYACENKRRYIGYPELEKVIRILIGQEPSSSKSLVKKLPENVFQNNQFSPADPKEVSVLISSIAHFNKNELIPRGVGFHELEKLWADQKLSSYKAKLADAINILEEKKILIKEEDEGLPVYKLSVDLFRRWWSIHYNDIDLILTSLIVD